MKTSAYLLFLSLLLIAFPVRSQVVRNCATMEVWQEMERSNPLLRQRQQQIEDFTNFRAKDAFRLVRDSCQRLDFNGSWYYGPFFRAKKNWIKDSRWLKP